MKKYNIALVGVGAVGVEMLRCLKQRNFPVGKLKIFARSARQMMVDNRTYNVEAISDNAFEGMDIVFFAGTEGETGAAVVYGPQAVKAGAVVIDNGSDFRLKEDVPLVVPEVNADTIKNNKGIIANPNCTTIQMVTALSGIQKKFGLEKIVLTTFQATSGAGRSAAEALWQETKALGEKNSAETSYRDIDRVVYDKTKSPFSAQIAFNAIPQIGGFGDANFTSEEWKTVKETHKIFDDSDIRISTTCVRIPVFGAHSEAVYFTTKEKVTLDQVTECFENTEGVVFAKAQGDYAMPLDVENKDLVYVGRLRKDPFEENTFWIWCVADNLRKGAALNAVQIAEKLV
ncbi:MAG: aspartate-semialdehyde dehydrogenase [Candidatus Omnitrophica bacterium]|nr:aspartate-semialdehyde dehydrogenase [Candidatus Omnitrophota bacterium]MDD5080517.1 aspartate-semialdehyde dehydrogenase [Candidatus Omnitrophota bacterium]